MEPVSTVRTRVTMRTLMENIQRFCEVEWWKSICDPSSDQRNHSLLPGTKTVRLRGEILRGIEGTTSVSFVNAVGGDGTACRFTSTVWKTSTSMSFPNTGRASGTICLQTSTRGEIIGRGCREGGRGCGGCPGVAVSAGSRGSSGRKTISSRSGTGRGRV